MSFLWGSEDPKVADARKILVDTYNKHNPEKLKEVDAILEAYKGKEDELVSSLKEKYGRLEKVAAVRAKLMEHYKSKGDDKVAFVEEMMKRFAGKEDELLEEINKQYPGGETAATHSPQSVETEDTAPIVLNASLPIKLQDMRIFYSGFLWQKTFGWLSSRQRTWCMLIGQTFYIGNDPADTAYDTISLKGAAVADEPDLSDGRFMFRLSHKQSGDLYFFTENETEKLMWAVKLEVAILQANPERSTDDDARATYHRVFTEYPVRPCVPFLKTLADVTPEKIDPPILSGYIVTKTGDSWVGDNWKRRFVTLHDCWFTIRGDKMSSHGTAVYPLRDAEVMKEGEGTFAVWSSFIPSISFSPDNTEAYEKWYSAFTNALDQSNPDSTKAKTSSP